MFAKVPFHLVRASTRIYINACRASSLVARNYGSSISVLANPAVMGSSIYRRFASSTTPHSTASDPAEVEAMNCLEQGTRLLEEGDVEGAKRLYARSAEMHRNASSLYNLGVTYYHLKDFDAAIASWQESIALQPDSPDAHTNLANAYILSPLPRPDLALHHLRIASSLAPQDPEIAFNLAAVLEATENLEESLEYYEKCLAHGIERAKMHIRNVKAKILAQRVQSAQSSGQSDE
ncbi:TPR-like protein [Lentinula aciculospora]|uniref:TPR-like protein n=1 Tax=Lentinula aciculospora TaxID=153920 RepID=A0A9W9DJQ3_9AGAR|nr:TPR-like protein [Lentinula aciculospora]